jgi:hypothetical protein
MGIWSLHSQHHEKKKDDLEKTEHEKNQQFRQQLHMKLHGLHEEMEKSIGEIGEQCQEFPNKGGTIRNMLD